MSFDWLTSDMLAAIACGLTFGNGLFIGYFWGEWREERRQMQNNHDRDLLIARLRAAASGAVDRSYVQSSMKFAAPTEQSRA